MSTNGTGYLYTKHIDGLEYHGGRKQPWTVYVAGRIVAFRCSLAEAQRSFTIALHGAESNVLRPEGWVCPGCKDVEGNTHAEARENAMSLEMAT